MSEKCSASSRLSSAVRRASSRAAFSDADPALRVGDAGFFFVWQRKALTKLSALQRRHEYTNGKIVLRRKVHREHPTNRSWLARKAQASKKF